jgi:O-antigen ligase
MLRAAELAMAAFAVVLLTGSHIYYGLLGIPADITAEEIVAYEGRIRNVLILAYLVVVLLSVIHWQKMILGMAAVWPIVLLVVIAWLSLLWSVAPEFTYRRAIALTITTLMPIYLFVRFDLETLLRFLTAVVAIIVIASLVWVFLVPAYGVHNEGEHTGAFRGIFFHKNTTGRVMVYCLAIVIAAWIGSGLNKVLLAGLGFLTLVMILGTTSQTTLLGTFSLFGGLIAVRMVRGQAIKSALTTLVILAIAWHGALIGLANYDLILEALGRDASLTGRTGIWEYTFQYALKQPFTGYGYDAFWNGDLSPGAQYAAYWKTPHSHNSWLEVFIALGLPAVLIMFVLMVVTLGRAVILARYYPTTTPAVLITLVCFGMLTIGMSEPVFLEKHSFDWILFVVIVGCARALTSKLRNQTPEQGADHPGSLSPAGPMRGYSTP